MAPKRRRKSLPFSRYYRTISCGYTLPSRDGTFQFSTATCREADGFWKIRLSTGWPQKIVESFVEANEIDSQGLRGAQIANHHQSGCR
jgi:hypothetical protein